MTDLPVGQQSEIQSAEQPEPRVFHAPKKGEVILFEGRYYFLGDFLSNGSFGAVYECSDEWENRLVAKVLLPRSRPYEEIRENWLQELIKLHELRHPNITFIHAAFEYNDTFYIVIERCAFTLEQLISSVNFSGAIWVPYIARDILQGLEYIHSIGYVHKDIHAGNVFVSHSYDKMVPEKQPVWSFKIGDVGISRLETEIEIFNTLLAQWMLPPEAIDPVEFGAVGRTTDVYHTALLLLYVITGTRPSFTREEIRAGAPRLVAESLASPYAEVLARALRRHVAARTPTALQFWRELASVHGAL